MKLLSIEPTPSPNSMKINLDETLPNGLQKEYTPQNVSEASVYIQRLLSIPGVKSVFRAADFIALDRFPQADWQEILRQVKEQFGQTSVAGDVLATGPTDSQDTASFGEAQVYLQMFRTIPLQVKVTANGQEARTALPDRFAKTAMKAGTISPNLIKERQWVEQGVRYGDLKEIGEVVAAEVDASYDEQRLAALLEEILLEAAGAGAESVATHSAVQADSAKPKSPLPPPEVLLEADWRKRYAALEQVNPEEHGEALLPFLSRALQDEKSSIRRLAVVYLGMIGGDAVLPLLLSALKDASVSVRRTAGDTLSDLGDPRAIPAMIEALVDPNKLVRWRAARFLFEQGDGSSLPGLHAAENDPEFEVRLQIKMAIERIERGEAASGSVWQQMTNRERS